MKDDGGPHGWLVIDKPLGLTSRRVVDIVQRYADGRVGHAGTLDPLATGVLPVAIGEATKTTAYAMAGRKRYRFRIRWGIARATDDLEGEVTGGCAARPSRKAIEAALPRLLGDQDRWIPRLQTCPYECDPDPANAYSRGGGASTHFDPGRRSRGLRSARWQGHLHPCPRARSRCDARNLRSRRPAAPAFGWPLRGKPSSHTGFTCRAGSYIQRLPVSAANRDRAGRHPGLGRDGGRGCAAAQRPEGYARRCPFRGSSGSGPRGCRCRRLARSERCRPGQDRKWPSSPGAGHQSLKGSKTDVDHCRAQAGAHF